MAALKDWLISQQTGTRIYWVLQPGSNKTPGLTLRVQIARETQTSEVVKKHFYQPQGEKLSLKYKVASELSLKTFPTTLKVILAEVMLFFAAKGGENRKMQTGRAVYQSFFC